MFQFRWQAGHKNRIADACAHRRGILNSRSIWFNLNSTFVAEQDGRQTAKKKCDDDFLTALFNSLTCDATTNIWFTHFTSPRKGMVSIGGLLCTLFEQYIPINEKKKWCKYKVDIFKYVESLTAVTSWPYRSCYCVLLDVVPIAIRASNDDIASCSVGRPSVHR